MFEHLMGTVNGASQGVTLAGSPRWKYPCMSCVFLFLPCLCPSVLLLLPPTGTGHSLVVVTMQGFHRHELKINSPYKASTSLLAFQLLPEVLQACVLKSRVGPCLVTGPLSHGDFYPRRSSCGWPVRGAVICISGA